MGLRCLLGHDFTEPRTERDREERGDEVVVSITEVKECKRCGETRVVSESKEVTSLTDHAVTDGPVDAGAAGAETEATDTDVGSVPTGVAEADSDAVDDDFDHPTADLDDDAVDGDVEEDAEIIDAEEPTDAASTDDGAAAPDTGRAHGEWPDADANRRDEAAPEEDEAAWPDDEPVETPDVAEDADGAHSPAAGEGEDVEILGDDAPDAEDPAANEARTDVVPDAAGADEAGAAASGDEDAEFIDGDGPSEWPEQRGEDEGYDAEVGADDAGVSVDGNLTPQVDADATEGTDEDVEFIEADPDAGRSSPPSARNGTAPDAAAERESSRPQVELTTTADRIETVYVCPDCGNREPVGASSMRAGDICPDCKRGYIEERELQ
ncbi:DUF7093 family protein [Halobaculum marinum]|uniref:Oxidoreductase n=1 Tax=Halobaculum marinum TaxID=3031996 RepID=A0ABD5WZV0_9EURY|nr:hypothetical protein [Halobaculum sp. DT55]